MRAFISVLLLATLVVVAAVLVVPGAAPPDAADQDTAAASTPAAAPAADKPAADGPAADEQVEETSAADEPPADEPALETPAADDLDLPAEAEIEAHSSFDPGPSLQRAPGGSLIVDAFIMDGPVRVEIRDRRTDELIMEKESDTLFSFEVSGRELGVEPEQALVRIYVKGSLAHELEMDRPEVDQAP